MGSSLTDRYVAAVLAGIHDDRRAGVERDLRAVIAEGVAARVGAGAPEVDAERAVLVELGDPMRLAAARTGRVLALVGPAVYPAYVRLLRLLLSIVVPIIAVLAGIAAVVAGQGLVPVLASAVSAGFSVGVQLAFWVTVVFAVIDRRGSMPTSTWDLDDLPTLEERRIGRGESVAAIVGLALLTWFLVWQPGYQATLGGPSIPILDPALSTGWIPLLVVVLIASIGLEIAKARVGRWTLALAAVNTVLNLAFAIPAVWLLLNDRVLNPAFLAAVAIPEAVDTLTFVPTIVAWVIAIVCALDSADGWWKAIRNARAGAHG